MRYDTTLSGFFLSRKCQTRDDSTTGRLCQTFFQTLARFEVIIVVAGSAYMM